MKKQLLALSALCAAMACTAAAKPAIESPHAARAPILAAPADAAVVVPAHYAPGSAASCDVRARRTANGVEITAFARSDRAVWGDYDLVITKTGPNGASDVTQGGDFSLRPGAAARLGTAEFSLERGARYRARLVLSDSHGEICRDVLRG
ncbi:MAG: curli-like amyloid fiber formation chaperone CsgH [Hyphomonadaceae bacterium]|nr:curli-like amyloid fiber formation chaperone CsgH [Hyphomonadaceae bacterium]